MPPNVTLELAEDLMAQWNVWKDFDMLLLEDHWCLQPGGYYVEFYAIFLNTGEERGERLKFSSSGLRLL